MGSAQEHYAYGMVYYDQKDFGHAYEEFKLALEQAPEHGNALLRAGRCLLAARDTAGALEHFEKALRLSPDFADAHFFMGQAFLERDERDSAINEFKEALNINPRFRAARAALSRMLKTGANGDSAPEQDISDDEKISHRANTHFHLGNALVAKNLLLEALAEYKAAVRLRPNYPDIRNSLGELYMKRGFFNLAAEEFKLALKINPRYGAALRNLAETLLCHARELVSESAALWERALEGGPDNGAMKEQLEKAQAVKDIFERQIPERSLMKCKE